jgi:hypothetical protein
VLVTAVRCLGYVMGPLVGLADQSVAPGNGPRAPRAERTPWSPAGAELRCHPGGPRRVGAVWSSQGSVHRRRAARGGSPARCGRRDALPGRAGRSARAHPIQAAEGRPGALGRPAGGNARGARERPARHGLSEAIRHARGRGTPTPRSGRTSERDRDRKPEDLMTSWGTVWTGWSLRVGNAWVTSLLRCGTSASATWPATSDRAELSAPG